VVVVGRQGRIVEDSRFDDTAEGWQLWEERRGSVPTRRADSSQAMTSTSAGNALLIMLRIGATRIVRAPDTSPEAFGQSANQGPQAGAARA